MTETIMDSKLITHPAASVGMRKELQNKIIIQLPYRYGIRNEAPNIELLNAE